MDITESSGAGLLSEMSIAEVSSRTFLKGYIIICGKLGALIVNASIGFRIEGFGFEPWPRSL